jgi:hypothetical protein
MHKAKAKSLHHRPKEEQRIDTKSTFMVSVFYVLCLCFVREARLVRVVTCHILFSVSSLVTWSSGHKQGQSHDTPELVFSFFAVGVVPNKIITCLWYYPTTAMKLTHAIKDTNFSCFECINFSNAHFTCL